jgi:hypothetical protein
MGDFNSVVASDAESSERWPFHAFWSKDGVGNLELRFSLDQRAPTVP